MDGVSSTSILINFFNEINIESEFYIPDRLKDGYGPKLKAFKYLEQKSCELILTVDCGTNAGTEISKVKNKNLDIIVIDHHLQNENQLLVVKINFENVIKPRFFRGFIVLFVCNCQYQS